MANRLYYGDNLDILRSEIAPESVDLIYLDPPFNSQASYNVLFKAPTGEQARAQIEAFEDTWHWNDTAERAFDEVLTSGHTDAAQMLRAMRSFLGQNDMMATQQQLDYLLESGLIVLSSSSRPKYKQHASQGVDYQDI